MIVDVDKIVVSLDVVAPDAVVVEASAVLPVATYKDKGSIYRGIMADEGVLMINGKAPFGSSEDDAVWTVYINPLDEFGNVVEEEIEVLENQIWSEIKNMYS